MRVRRTVCVAILGITVLTAVGCVDRRFVVTSNVPGAQVTVDGEQLGPAPVDARYEYTGKREFRAYAPGFEPYVQLIGFEPRWYDYPGLDLFAEVFWPFRIEDVRRVHLELQPAQPVPVDQIQTAAEQLRGRGQALPPPSVPNDQPAPVAPQFEPAIPSAMRGMFPPTGSTPIPPSTPGRFGGR
jgi:PEGA domain